MTSPHIGNRPVSLAQQLRLTAHYIESGRVKYNFTDGHTCNVGCLARVVTGLDAYSLAGELAAIYAPIRALRSDAPNIWDNWSNTAKNACPLDGSTAKGVVGKLQDAGMLVEDFDHLEHLKHPELVTTWVVVEGVKHYAIAQNVVGYMRRWALAIEAFNAAKREIVDQDRLDAVEMRPLVHL